MLRPLATKSSHPMTQTGSMSGLPLLPTNYTSEAKSAFLPLEVTTEASKDGELSHPTSESPQEKLSDIASSN